MNNETLTILEKLGYKKNLSYYKEKKQYCDYTKSGFICDDLITFNISESFDKNNIIVLFSIDSYGKHLRLERYLESENIYSNIIDFENRIKEYLRNVKNENIPFGIYKHYKGNRYEVVNLANHSETLEKLVVYKALYETADHPYGTFWVRPLEMFFDLVTTKDYELVPRFERAT